MKIITAALFLAMAMMSTAHAQEPTDNPPESVAEKNAEAPAKPLTLHNFKLNADEDVLDPQSMSVEKGKEFIPPLPVAEELYLNYIEQGATALEAITYTYVDLQKAMSEIESNE